MTLKKLPFKEIKYMGVQCPLHMPTYCTEDHAPCLKEWKKRAIKQYKESYEYKMVEVINSLIDAVNRGDFQCSCKSKAQLDYREYNGSC